LNYLEEWFHNLQSKAKTSIAWQRTIRATGECHRHTGPSIWFASVVLEFSPSKQFEVEDTLNPEVAHLIRDRGWYDYIVFGVLDVMLAKPPNPIVNFKLSIRQIDFNEVESNSMAFRLAARNAAEEALSAFSADA